MNKTRHIINAALFIALAIGVLNNIYKYRKLPTVRYFAGAGILYFFILALARYEEEIAKNVALAITVFVIIGEGGGLLDHFLGKGTAETTLDTQPKESRGEPSPGIPTGADIHRRETGINAVSAWTGLYLEKPVIPHYGA